MKKQPLTEGSFRGPIKRYNSTKTKPIKPPPSPTPKKEAKP